MMTICDAISHLRLRFPDALIAVYLTVTSYSRGDPEIEWAVYVGHERSGKRYTAKTLQEATRAAEGWQDFPAIETGVAELVGSMD